MISYLATSLIVLNVFALSQISYPLHPGFHRYSILGPLFILMACQIALLQLFIDDTKLMF